MNLYLIRHTKVALKAGICYGQSDIELADTFNDEVEEIKVQLSDIKFDKIFSSPLTRCKILSKYLFGANIIYDNRLKELNFGDWEMQEWDKINHPLIDRWMTDFVNTHCPNGESFVDLNMRVSSFLKNIKGKEFNNVGIITHSGVMRSILTQHENEDLKNAFKRDINYGEVIKLNF